MSAKIEKKFGVKANLATSSEGAFEVYKDGEKIYSKLKTGKFPDPDQILELLGK